MSVHTDLRELEERFWRAGGDPEFWDRSFAEDGVIALATGLMDKHAVVAAQDAAEPWETFTIEEARVVELGEGVASISYRVTARRAGDDSDYRAVVSSVYVRRGGDWMLALHHQTPTE